MRWVDCYVWKPATVWLMAWSFAPVVLGQSQSQTQPAWRPDKPVEFTVATAGGNSDRITRLAQRILQGRKLLTVPATVMNRTGGNQTLAALHMTQHAGDAHYVLLANPAMFTNELNGISKLRYTDFTPLALLVIESSVLAVRGASPLTGVSDRVDVIGTSRGQGTRIGGTNALRCTGDDGHPALQSG